MPPRDSGSRGRVKPRISIIVAVAENGVIGRAGGLPWRLPADLRRFRERTMGHPVIMGRRTWESIGRPLPGRRNIVVTRTPGFRAPGAEIAGSLEEALRLAGDTDEIFVIGGAQLYAEALPRADRIYMTRVRAAPEGDAWFPPWNPAEWVELGRAHHPADQANPFAFDEIVYDSRRAHLESGLGNA